MSALLFSSLNFVRPGNAASTSSAGMPMCIISAAPRRSTGRTFPAGAARGIPNAENSGDELRRTTFISIHVLSAFCGFFFSRRSLTYSRGSERAYRAARVSKRIAVRLKELPSAFLQVRALATALQQLLHRGRPLDQGVQFRDLLGSEALPTLRWPPLVIEELPRLLQRESAVLGALQYRQPGENAGTVSPLSPGTGGIRKQTP